MQPLVVLLNSQRDVASLAWEKKEQTIIACASRHSHSKAPRVLLGIAKQPLQQKGSWRSLYESLAELFEKPSDTVEQLQWQVAMGGQAFKLLSRQGALIYVGLSAVHQGYLLPLCKRLREPPLTRPQPCVKLTKVQQCMLDDWPQEMEALPGLWAV